MMELSRKILLALAALLLLAGGAVVYAQTGGDFDLTWNTIDGGGAASTGGGYTLSGTVGQPDAGAMSGGNYALTGGFWSGAPAGASIYLPLVLR
jgi:hypothetical protein